MPGLRHAALVPAACVLLLAGALPSAHAAERNLPETVTVRDGRTSPPVVDISAVKLRASWYYDSEQYVQVTVPNGYQPGHRLTVWFDLNGDSTPDGHYVLELRKPKRPGGEQLQSVQEFRLGGGWDGAGTRVRCSDGEGFPPFSGTRRGARTVYLGLDLWWCLKTPNPVGSDPASTSGSWRVAVRVVKGRNSDMAPDHRTWSAPVAGWEACHPEEDEC